MTLIDIEKMEWDDDEGNEKITLNEKIKEIKTWKDPDYTIEIGENGITELVCSPAYGEIETWLFNPDGSFLHNRTTYLCPKRFQKRA